MGSEANRFRRKWQDYGGKNATQAEKDFYSVFKELFIDTEFEIRDKPDDFKDIYVDFPLDEKVLSEIYTPNKPITKHGIKPDYAIDNLETNKTIYIEVKRQDGWVEGKPRSAGRGNAHERSNKFFTPGLLKILREESGIDEPNLPFWTVFIGDITRDPCRVREVTCWYANYIGHYFFWRDSSNAEDLINHFENYILPLLEETTS